MIGYTTVGTNNLEAAAAFYDGLLASEGVKRVTPNDRMCLWAKKGAPMFGVAVPYNDQPATCGNGSMIALSLASQDEVNAMYKRALELGGTDEGEPGPRGPGGFYGGYCRDLDGNKLAFFCMVKG